MTYTEVNYIIVVIVIINKIVILTTIMEYAKLVSPINQNMMISDINVHQLAHLSNNVHTELLLAAMVAIILGKFCVMFVITSV